MGIDFHASELSATYASRSADEAWLQWLGKRVDLAGKKAVDVGCGGGIYTKAIAESGASEVIGVDFSASMLEGAKANCAHHANVRFVQGDATNTGLEGGAFDFVLMRALLHHFDDVTGCIKEAEWLLRPGGVYLVQDRTAEDCLLPGDGRHMRGYFFETFPRLARIETARRHQGSAIKSALLEGGFNNISEETIWETRRVYTGAEAFRADLLERTGRSILHELSDAELIELADRIEAKVTALGVTDWIEQDRWTLWMATKKGG